MSTDNAKMAPVHVVVNTPSPRLGLLKPLKWLAGDAGRQVAESAFGRYDVLMSDNVWMPQARCSIRCASMDHGKHLCSEDHIRRVSELFEKVE